jgi:phosphatidate cytidylyltransferase
MSLKERVTTTAAVLPLLCLVFLFAGEWIVGVMCLLASLLAAYETSLLVSKALDSDGDSPFNNISFYLLGCSLIYICSSLMFVADKYFFYLPLVSIIFFVFSAYLLLHGKSFKDNIKNTVVFAFIILYCCLPWIIIWRIYCLADYARYVFLLFAVVFSADTGAYFGGKFFGKRLLAPVVSPNKTWEGVFFGILASVIASLLYCYFLNIFVGSLWIAIIVGAVASALAVVGDLVESALKRCANVKDSGKIFPGHGGLLDRVDGLIFAAPFVQLMALFDLSL